MIVIKKTLLSEIQDLEKQAETIVSTAKEQVAKEVAEIRQRTENARRTIREKAAQTSRNIIDEQIQAAKQEANEIKDQSNLVISQVRAAAQKNRARTLDAAKSFFKKEYGIEL